MSYNKKKDSINTTVDRWNCSFMVIRSWSL